MKKPFLLKAEQLSIGYPGRPLYRNLSFEFPTGSRLGILGANGSGKSTFIKTLLGLIPPLAGRYEWNGAPSIAYVPQEQQIDRIFPLSVQDMLRMGESGTRAEFDQKAGEMLRLFELSPQRKTLWRELSGGQRQRCLIARALMGDPEVLVMDEPLNSLDSIFRGKIWDILQTRLGLSWMVIDHDLNRVLHQVDWLCLLGGGKVLCAPKAELLNEVILSEAFGEKVHLHEENGRHQIHFL